MRFLRERSQRLPLILAGVVALLVLNTAISATRYLAIENRLRLPIEDSPVWATAQLEVELARFLLSLESFSHADGQVTRDQLVERFDVAWSRLALFSAGVNARWLQDKPLHRASLDRLQADLEAIDPMVAGAGADQNALRRIRERILPHLPVIKQITAASVQEEVDDRATLAAVQNDLRSEIKAFSLSALAAFAGLAFYLVRAEARSRASVRELSAARAEAEAASSRLSEAIANISEGFVLYDAQDRLVISNAKYREYYNLSADAIRPGRRFEDILRAGVERGQYEDAKGDPDGFVRERLQRRRALGDAFEQRLGDGRWLMISDRRTREGGVAGIRTDITEIKRREQELEEAKQTLQRQAEELRLLAERERKANAAKSVFLATLSHEIRTPMNAVVGLSDLLAGTALDAQSERYVAAINDAASQLLHLINTILDLSRLEAGRAELDLAPFDLRDTLARLASVAAALTASKPVTVSCETAPDLPAHALGDQGRLYQVLLNLLANSVKFTAQGAVTLRAARLSGAPGAGDWVRFEIADTGPGLPEPVFDRLFEPFVRGEAADHEQGGTGLGLAISRRFVDLMGGRIGVAATSPSGTTFFVELPLPAAEPQETRPPETQSAPAGARRLRVLVAEDTPSSRMVVEAMLERLGHAVVCVEDGRAAVEAVLGASFDLILMDMQMPVLDGVAATRAIRAMPAPKGTVPIVFLTAQALPDARRIASEAGTRHYLTKPTRLADLEAKVAEAMGDAAGTDGRDGAATAPGQSLAPMLAAMEPALAELREAFDAATFRAVLARFAQDARERVAALEQACSAGDVATIRREAHKLAGILGQVGLTAVAARARAASHAEADEDVCAAARPLLADCGPALAALASVSEGEPARAGGEPALAG